MTNLEKVLEEVRDLEDFEYFSAIYFFTNRTRVNYCAEGANFKNKDFTFCNDSNCDEEYIEPVKLSKIEFEILESLEELHDLNEMLGYCYRTFNGFIKNGEINKEVFMNYVVILEDVYRRLKELYK